MPTMFFQWRHLRQVALRRLAIASCLGGFLTFLFGAWLAPWLWEVGFWLLHRLPWWQPVPFPSLVPFVAAPTIRLGSIWLVYYLLTYLWAMLTRSPRQRQAYHASWELECRDDDWSLSAYTRSAPRQEALLSQA